MKLQNNRWVLALGLLALLASQIACGDDDVSQALGVNNVSPLGSVGGIVLQADTMKPLKGVKITIVAGGKTYPAADGTAVETDSEGIFAVNDIEAGNILVKMSAPSGYQGVTLSETIPNSAGEFPLANSTLSIGPIGLLPLATASQAFRVLLVTADGAPAPKITAHLRSGMSYVDFSTGNPVARGTHVVSAATNNLGKASFANMPDFNKLAGMVGIGGLTDLVRVRVPPYDSNNDNIMDFLGKETIYNVLSLKGHIPTIVLDSSAPTTLKIEASSIAALAGKKGVRQLQSSSGPLYAAFNWPLDSKLTMVSLYDSDGKRLATTPTKTVTGNLLAINFVGLNAGSEYNITIRAVASSTQDLLEGTFGAPFFTPPVSGSTVTAALTRASTDPQKTDYNKIIVTFSEPVGTGVPGQSLTGSNSVLFFSYDLDNSSKTGDSPGEKGYTSSNIPMTIVEIDPPGPAGLSGLSKTWSFILPKDKYIGTPVPGGTPLDIIFSASTSIMQRASGEQLKDMFNLTIPN